MRLHLAPLLLCLSCYSPDIPSGKFACTQDADCPEPLKCRPVQGKGSRCVETTPPTLGGSDACAGETVVFSATVLGCRGGFGVGEAAALCKAGFHPCEGKDSMKLTLGAVCEGAVGFFASRIPVEEVRETGIGQAGTRPYSVDCDINGTVDAPHGLIGCGTEDGARRISSRDKCPSVSTAYACGMSSRWTCDGGGLDKATYDGKGGGGVLCCAD